MPTQEELQQRIRELERQVASLTAVVKQTPSFGLTWIDVPEAFDAESENKIPILEEVPDLAIRNDDGKPTHILIEGDNYHALTCLNYTHRGKVDVIYIDPPYNTGSDGFTYKDRRFLNKFPNGTTVPPGHPLRHSSWLSFMHKRLLQAKEILKQDGVMFISIGEDELATLIMLCDKLFERIAIVPRIAKKGSDQGTYFRPTKDYILVYAQDKALLPHFAGLEMGEERSYPFTEGERKYRKAHSLYQASLDPLRGCVNQRYYIEAPDGTLIIPPGNTFPAESRELAKVAPQTREDKVWRWSAERFRRDKTLVMFDKSKRSPLVDQFGNHTDWNVYERKYEDEELADMENPLPDDVIYDFTNSLATTRLAVIDIDFQFSKPYELIKYLLKITNKRKDAVVLDFFAGSGTTMEAVMSLNEDDEGHRTAILCQDNDEGICRKITLERNKRIMNGYVNKSTRYVTPPIGNSLKYYRTAFVGKHQPKGATDEDKLALAKKAGCLLALAENTLDERLTTDYYQAYTDGKGRWTAIYFQEDYSHFEAFRESVAALQGRTAVYVFCWTDGSEFQADFEHLRDVTVKSIPQPILDIYKSLNL